MSNYIIHWGIPGMKWGVRRYRNSDGTLTEAGKRRYQRDVDENKARKKDNRITLNKEDVGDPYRWAKEDLTRSRNVVNESRNLVSNLDNLNRTTTHHKTKKTDLSGMTDKEMRDKINRELLERQYNQLFNDVDNSKVNTGRQVVNDTLSVVGGVLGVAASSLGIALAVKELRGK